MRGGAGAVCRFPFSARNAALGGTDGSDRRRQAGLCCWRRTVLRRNPLSRYVAYCGTFIGCIAALVIIILMIRAPLLMMLVCCLWAGFVPGFRRWSRSKTPMPGGWRVHRADYHYYHPYQSDAGAAVCCRTLQRNCHRYCQRHRRRSPVFAAFD